MSLVSFAGHDHSERQFKIWSHGLRAKTAPKPTILCRMQAMFRSGMDTCEIAEAFNLEEHEVYNRLARARERA